MKKIYKIPELDIVCFAPWEKLAADDFGAQYFGNSPETEGVSGMEVPIETDPEGGID